MNLIQLSRHNIKQIVTTNLIFNNNYALLIAFLLFGSFRGFESGEFSDDKCRKDRKEHHTRSR